MNNNPYAPADIRDNTFAITTFGCQMNENDSEKIAALLVSFGWTRAENARQAQLVVLNTCSVRANADERFFGHLGNIKNSKKGRILAVGGCLMQQKEAVGDMLARYPFVDVVFGTHNLSELPSLIEMARTSSGPVVRVKDDGPLEELEQARVFSHRAFVSIMNGCDNFCSYCVVPMARGREKSRQPEAILAEIASLAKAGCKEIMLLGQNVNSYGLKGLEPATTFAGLLRAICESPETEGVERVRFMTSHPKDFSDPIIEAMATYGKICPSVHLPMQSGSDRILALMNRKYTVAHYLSLVQALRNAVPDVSVTTDIIVGFPGETEEDFDGTLDAVRQAAFDSAFTFIYSPRPGTPAAKMSGAIPKEVSAQRFSRLTSTLYPIMLASNEREVGKTLPVLSEGPSREDAAVTTGRTPNNKLVHFAGQIPAGQNAQVTIEKASTFYLLAKTN